MVPRLLEQHIQDAVGSTEVRTKQRVGGMMMDWEPKEMHDDPNVNAMLNVAASIHACAKSLEELLYGLKYSKRDGLSVAEAIEVAGKKIAEAIGSTAQADLEDALDRIAGRLESDDGTGIGQTLRDILTDK
jgi:hypothetical protein